MREPLCEFIKIPRALLQLLLCACKGAQQVARDVGRVLPADGSSWLEEMICRQAPVALGPPAMPERSQGFGERELLLDAGSVLALRAGAVLASRE